MLKNKKALAMSVLCAIASVGFVVSASAAEQTMHGNLDEVVVEGSKDALPGGYTLKTSSVGIIGDKPISDTPFTKVNLSNKSVTSFEVPGEGLSSALMNVPSIKSASSTMYNDVNIRGQRVNGYQFYINGVPGLLTQTNIPTNFIENIEVTSGPAMSFTGTTTQETAGGMVNMVSKRAGEEDVTKYKQTFSGKSSFGEYIDIGRRFGQNKEWGLRVNAQNISGETQVPGEKLAARDFFMNLDHKDDKSNTNFLAGYRYVKHENGVRWFQYGNGVTNIPSAPNAKNNYSFQGQQMEYDTWLLTLNHEQKINDDWSAYVNAGYSKYDLSTNYNAKSSAYIIQNNNGDFVAQSWSKTFPVSSYYAQIGVKGDVKMGEVTNHIALSLDEAWYNNGSGITGVVFNNSVYGNIYNNTHIVGDPLPDKKFGTWSAKSKYYGISLADTIDYGKASLLLGIHSHKADVTTYNPDNGVKKGNETSRSNSPTYALSYKPTDNWTMYASHTESFNRGALVPQSANGNSLQNASEMLSPTKTKQNEVGIKYNNNNFYTALSFFDIKQESNYDVQRADGWYRVQDGENEYKGVELSASAQLNKWNLMGGVMYMDAKVNDAQDKSINGTRINGLSKWNGVLGVEYAADDKFSALGRVLYNGSATIKNETLSVPSYCTLDMGVKYKTKLSNTPVTLSAMCYNVTGKDYWITSGNTTILSNPRTVMLSAEFDL